MGKQHKHPFEDNPFIEGFFDWMDSAEGGLSGEALDIVWTLLENADVDAKNRQIIWDDGKRRSITESAQHIHANYPELPLELIESMVIGWLEMDFAPETYSREQLDELDRLTEKWIKDHERQAKKGKKPGRSPHS